MKGLLLKDWYMMRKYCRSYLLIAAVFIAVSLYSNDNLFFIFINRLSAKGTDGVMKRCFRG